MSSLQNPDPPEEPAASPADPEDALRIAAATAREISEIHSRLGDLQARLASAIAIIEASAGATRAVPEPSAPVQQEAAEPPSEESTRKTDVAPVLVLTDEQQRVLHRAFAPKTKITAGAGAGKTTILRLLAERRAATKHRGLYLAFNKAIADEAAGKFPSTVDCRTAHALAYRQLGMRNYRDKLRANIYPQDVASILRVHNPDLGYTPAFLHSAILSTVFAFCQSADLEITEFHCGLPDREAARWIAGQARLLWEKMAYLDDMNVKITHDVYLKLWQLRAASDGLGYDYLLVDEAQDLNPVMSAVLQSFRGHTFWVGDPYQQIYSFRGAVNAMRDIEAPEVFLSQSWRFGDAIAAAANRVLSYAAETPRMTVRGNPAIESTIAVTGQTQTTIFRTNAGIFKAALLSETSFHIVGGFDEIAGLLLSAYALFSGRDEEVHHGSIRRFRAWSELESYAEEMDDPELALVVRIVEKHSSHLPRLIDKIRSRIVDESAAEQIFTTGHKAKGREWDSVRIAGDFKHPEEIVEMRKKKPSQTLEEEINLAYVTLTRARRLLVTSSDWYETLTSTS